MGLLNPCRYGHPGPDVWEAPLWSTHLLPWPSKPQLLCCPARGPRHPCPKSGSEAGAPSPRGRDSSSHRLSRNPTRAALSWPLHRSCYAQLALEENCCLPFPPPPPLLPGCHGYFLKYICQQGVPRRGCPCISVGQTAKALPCSVFVMSGVLLCTGIPNSPVLRASGYLHKGSFVGNSRSLGLAGTADSISLQVGAEPWTARPGGLSSSLPHWLFLEGCLPLHHLPGRACLPGQGQIWGRASRARFTELARGHPEALVSESFLK